MEYDNFPDFFTLFCQFFLMQMLGIDQMLQVFQDFLHQALTQSGKQK